MSNLTDLIDAIVVDLEANVSLPATVSGPWKYVEPRVERADQAPCLAVWTDGAAYSLISTPNTYERSWSVYVEWVIPEFAGTEFGGSGDAQAMHDLEPVVEALAGRVSQYGPLGGIPGYTGASGPPSATVRLVAHVAAAVAGAVYRGRIQLEVTEEVDYGFPTLATLDGGAAAVTGDVRWGGDALQGGGL